MKTLIERHALVDAVLASVLIACFALITAFALVSILTAGNAWYTGGETITALKLTFYSAGAVLCAWWMRPSAPPTR